MNHQVLGGLLIVASLKISHIPCLSYLLMIYSTRMLYEVYCISTQDLEINRKELGLKPYIYININIYIYISTRGT